MECEEGVKEALIRAIYYDYLNARVLGEEPFFYDVVSKMNGDRRIRQFNGNCFDRQQSAPDLALMTRRGLFLFEYKDMRVSRDVADGSDIDSLMNYLENRLNKRKSESGGNKGLTQLVSNMEDFFSGMAPWGDLSRKGNVKVYPILVVNSRLFGIRGVNFVLQSKLQQRIMESEVLRNHSNEIGDLLVTDMDTMILVAAQSYLDFAQFQRVFFGYQTHIKRLFDAYCKYDSFRSYVMNKWDAEKTEKHTRRFKKRYKTMVKTLLR